MIAANGKGSFDNLVGQQILVDGFSIFTLGNFSIRKNVDIREIKSYKLNGFLREIDISKGTTEKIKFNFDFKDFTSFALYGSLRERLRGAINNIINNFPAGLYVYQNVPNSNTYDNLIISTDLQTSEFEILDQNIYNPYSINYRLDQTPNNNIRNFIQRYTDYVVMVNNIEYEIISVVVPQNGNAKLGLKILGTPFSSTTQPYFILPKYNVRQELYNDLGEFENYLLNQRTTPIYTATFRNIVETNFGSGRRFQEDELTWPSFDGYNPDINSFSFNTYLDNLLEAAAKIDDSRSNYLIRMLLSPEVVQEDNDDFSFQKIVQIYGREFDDIRNYIESLSYMATVSYDKKRNIPDQLIKNFADSLGLRTNSFYNEESLLTDIFSKENNNIAPTWGKNLSPIDIDNEIWRRLVINFSYLSKSKGTRKVLDFILKFIGAPDSLFQIEEYVFVGVQKVDINNLAKQIPQLTIDEIQVALPIDNEGYPDVEKIDAEFHSNGIDDYGLNYISNLTDFNLSIGQTDRIDGFTLSLANDDRKTWTSIDTNRVYYSDTRKANYSVSDERLVVNTKNLNIYISPDKAIEYSVFTETLANSATTITNFYEYIQNVYSTSINPQNRKVSLYYPKLQKIWFDYVNSKYSKDQSPLTYNDINKYIKTISGIWDDLLIQFIPATSILTSGKKTGNTVFGRNKFAYKYGEDTSSLFKTEDGEFYKIERGDYYTVKSKGNNLTLLNAETKSLLKFRNKYINLHYGNDLNYQLASSFLSDFRWFDNIYISLFKNNYLQLDFYENNYINSTSLIGQPNKREGVKNTTYYISGFNTSSKNVVPCNSQISDICSECIVESNLINGEKKIKDECRLTSNFNTSQPLTQTIYPRYRDVDNFIVNLATLFTGNVNLYDFTISQNSTSITGTTGGILIQQASLPGIRLSVQDNKYLLLTIDYNLLPLDNFNGITCSIDTIFSCDSTIKTGVSRFVVKFITPQTIPTTSVFGDILTVESGIDDTIIDNNSVLTTNSLEINITS